MINAHSESEYLYRGLRALVGFRLQTWKSWLRHGHFIRSRAIARYLASNAVVKVHLGATHNTPGFLNSQVCGEIPIDISAPLPFPDASIDLLYSSHVVEHLHRLQFREFLVESMRVLKPGGLNIMATPSLGKIISVLYGSDQAARETLLGRGARFSSEPFHTAGQQINITMRAFGHRWLYDREYMTNIGQLVGFRRVDVIGNTDLPDDGLREYVRQRKPAAWDLETETYVFEK
ncbi:methyltransferase domain-containing protein [Ferrovibrio sp.]|uniref:class I SAM-dependent methyltransferase n=1 Tax=Ferrovibrio sp. TaxID=1917215 RepID=UPI0026194409|nr:methyltransferase domain-containing protein [Ferrovibrio sp.]